MEDKRPISDIKYPPRGHIHSFDENIVLEKNIFSKVFDKDIRRVYIFKKAERIAKAIQLVLPAFKDSRVLRERMERVSVELMDASVLPVREARERLSRGLLSLSSSLEVGKSGGFLSEMNASIIAREAGNLLQEIASYEEPSIALPDVPPVARLAREALSHKSVQKIIKDKIKDSTRLSSNEFTNENQGQKTSERRDAILSLLKGKDGVHIKEVSTKFRDVSEKTIQRELQQLVLDGLIEKSGDRRWTKYRLADVPQDGQSFDVL